MRARTLLTAEEFDNYPFEEDKRYELDEGELIEIDRPASKHNCASIRLTSELFQFLETSKLGEVLNSENLFALASDIRRAPDLAVILGDRREELRDARVIPIVPEIVCEVLSPSETALTIHRKLKQYFAAGVKEAWLIDPESSTAEIWTGPRLPERELTVEDSLTSSLLPGFALRLAELFD